MVRRYSLTSKVILRVWWFTDGHLSVLYTCLEVHHYCSEGSLDAQFRITEAITRPSDTGSRFCRKVRSVAPRLVHNRSCSKYL